MRSTKFGTNAALPQVFYRHDKKCARQSSPGTPTHAPEKRRALAEGPDRNVGVTRNGMLRMEHIVTYLKGDLNLIRTRLNTFSDEITHALSRDLPQSDDEEEDNDVKLSITQKHEVQ